MSYTLKYNFKRVLVGQNNYSFEYQMMIMDDKTNLLQAAKHVAKAI